MRSRILLIDKNGDARERLQSSSPGEATRIVRVRGPEEALEQLGREAFDAIVVVGSAVDGEALRWCERIGTELPDLDIIVAATEPGLGGALDAFRVRASDYVPGPFDAEEVLRAVQRARERRRLDEYLRPLPAPKRRQPFDELVGESPPIRAVRAQLARVVDSDATVLITGETGTGKEVIARALHRYGPRARGPFVGINCAAIPAHLLESELFGHEKGAFTGATRARRGLFSQANGGTFFLDEVGSLPQTLQPKLLRALQEHAARPVGGDREVPFDARIVAASHEGLRQAVKQGRFREDLFFRLNVIHVELPPLRDRGYDVLLLAQHFVAQIASRRDTRVAGFTPAVARCLLEYPWPGNVRELQNCMEAAAVGARYDHIRTRDLPARIGDFCSDASRSPGDDAVVPLEAVECSHLARVMRDVRGDESEAARILDVDAATLRRKLQYYGLEGLLGGGARADEPTGRFGLDT